MFGPAARENQQGLGLGGISVIPYIKLISLAVDPQQMTAMAMYWGAHLLYALRICCWVASLDTPRVLSAHKVNGSSQSSSGIRVNLQ